MSETEMGDKPGYRTMIKTTMFIAWLTMTIFFIVSLEWKDVLYQIGDSVVLPFVWANPFVKLLAYIGVTGTMMIFGLEKGSLNAIIGMIYNPKMDAESKLAFITEKVEKMIGIGIAIKESVVIKENAKKIAESATAVAKAVSDSIPQIPPKPIEPPK